MLGLHVVRRGGGYIPRKKCVHCPTESQVLVGHPCSSGAISSHLPCWLKSMISGDRIQPGLSQKYILDDFAVLDDTLDFLDHRRAHAHCIPPVSDMCPVVFIHMLSFPSLTLFANQRIIAIVRIVRVPHGGTTTITKGSEVEFYSVSG